MHQQRSLAGLAVISGARSALRDGRCEIARRALLSARRRLGSSADDKRTRRGHPAAGKRLFMMPPTGRRRDGSRGSRGTSRGIGDRIPLGSDRARVTRACAGQSTVQGEPFASGRSRSRKLAIFEANFPPARP